MRRLPPGSSEQARERKHPYIHTSMPVVHRHFVFTVQWTGYTMVVDIGAALGPTLGYTLIDGFGLDAVYYSSTAFLLLITAGWLWFIVRKPRPHMGDLRRTV